MIFHDLYCSFEYSDNDRSSLNCASMLKGGWWWKSCGRGLNGLYMDDPNDLTARQGKYGFKVMNIVLKLRRILHILLGIIFSLNKTFVLAFIGIVWFRWKGWDYTLKRARMMIRPKSFISKFG